jgi:hypothetical protein
MGELRPVGRSLPAQLLDGFQAMKAAEAARNGWWAEARERHLAGGSTEACDDAASLHDDRARAIRDGLRAKMLAHFAGWTEDMVRDIFA